MHVIDMKLLRLLGFDEPAHLVDDTDRQMV